MIIKRIDGTIIAEREGNVKEVVQQLIKERINMCMANLDLSEAYLSRADLSGAHLSDSNMFDINILGANLSTLSN